MHKEKINKKPICLRLFKYLIIGTLVRHITTNIIAKNEPNRMKLLKGIKNVTTIITINAKIFVLGSSL